ncbi:hypothetical protein OIDMADRAFT_57132 [Oidiodendron maius Zn]|uniref:Uncharacterized protein n=1 Tax=Oidiodendron maius (strain Zn) TaxID=913774 RepID=A0A0C3CFB5_OIDMZ|nr:hypothetical protein OIDMADRAFT_57132 [Oidiodendron maius Zn]
MVASLTNSIAAAFRMVYHVFSDPVVLEECLEEVEQLVHVESDGFHNADLANVNSSCPVLLSTWQETLCYVHVRVSARVVIKNTMLNNKYLLKKGATVMTVAPVQHTDASVWGPTVGTFSTTPGFCGSLAKSVRILLHFDLSAGEQYFVPGVTLQKDGKWEEPRKVTPMTRLCQHPRMN